MAAVFSSVVPGSGQALRGRIPQAAIAFLISAALLGCTWLIERAHGGGAAVLFLMLLVLPWWAIQSYDAWLTAQSSEAGLGQTLKVIWVRAHDVRYLGALFLLTALMDLYIIVANPGYSLTVFRSASMRKSICIPGQGLRSALLMGSCKLLPSARRLQL